MELNTRFAICVKLIVALTLGLGACTLAYATVQIAWVALSVGVMVAYASAWQMLRVPIRIDTDQPLALHEEQDIWATDEGEIVDLGTLPGRVTFAHDGVGRGDDILEDD